jgi:glycosyltransferase involved in cell wall biosynthesis
MKVVLNVGAATWLGGRYYLENLALALRQLEPGDRPRLAVMGDADFPAHAAERAGALPADADVVFPNWGLHDTGDIAQIHWIPDLQHKALPDNFSFLERHRRDLGYRRLIRQARLVVVSSKTVGAGVGSTYRRSRSKLRVLHFRTVVSVDALATDPHETVERLGLPPDFILLPNQFWAHKNHATAFAALDRLSLPLVCTGETADHRRPGYAERLLEDVRSRGLSRRLNVLGVVPRQEYLELVRAARAIVQPSLFEGWSSIIEDARAFGKPVAVSDIPVHREQDPPRGFFFSPEDPAGLVRAVDSAIECGSASETDALRHQGELVRAYAERFVAIAAEASGTIDP